MSERRTQGGDRGGPRSRAARDRAARIRGATELAMLRLSGEVGYERASVVAVVEKSGSNLSRFYKTFASKERCYAEAYEHAADDLCERLLAGCREATDWTDGMKRSLVELAEFVDADPSLAAGLIGEVQVAGGAAVRKREAVIKRLSSAVDRVRGAVTVSPGEPPAITSTFVVEAIEATVVRSLAENRPVSEALPGLLFIAVAYYFGAPEARRAVRGFPGKA